MKQLCEDGRIPDTELEKNGIVVGNMLKSTSTKITYVVKSLENELTVLLSTTGSVEKNVSLSRTEAMQDLIPVAKQQSLEVVPANFPDPSSTFMAKKTAYMGIALGCLQNAFQSSTEASIKYIKDEKGHRVVACDDFGKGKLQLVALTMGVQIGTSLPNSASKCLGMAFTIDQKRLFDVCNSKSPKVAHDN